MLLAHLKPGRRFVAVEDATLAGVLVRVNDCRAVVRLDRPAKVVHFVTADGRECCFERQERTQSLTPFLEIVPR